jgi:hypothetical protein
MFVKSLDLLIPFPFLLSVLLTLFSCFDSIRLTVWALLPIKWIWDSSSFIWNRLIFTRCCGETCKHVRTLRSLSSTRLCAVLLKVFTVYWWGQLSWFGFMISIPCRRGHNKSDIDHHRLPWINCCWGCWIDRCWGCGSSAVCGRKVFELMTCQFYLVLSGWQGFDLLLFWHMV